MNNYRTHFGNLLTESTDEIFVPPKLQKELNTNLEVLEYHTQNSKPFVIYLSHKNKNSGVIFWYPRPQFHGYVQEVINQKAFHNLNKTDINNGYENFLYKSGVMGDAHYSGRVWLFWPKAIVSCWNPPSMKKDQLMYLALVEKMLKDLKIDPSQTYHETSDGKFVLLKDIFTQNINPEDQKILDQKRAEHLKAGMKNAVTPKDTKAKIAGSVKRNELITPNFPIPSARDQFLRTSEGFNFRNYLASVKEK